MAKQYFQLIEGKSAKYWHIDLSGSSHTAHYGRIGTPGQTTTKSFASSKAAKAACEKLIEQKVRKGYVKATAQVAAEHTAAAKPASAKKATPATKKKTATSNTKRAAKTPKKVVKKKASAAATKKKVTGKKASAPKGKPAKLDMVRLMKMLKKRARGYDQNQLGKKLKSASPKLGKPELLNLAGKWDAADVVQALVDANFDFNTAGKSGKFYTVNVTVTKLMIEAGFDVKSHGDHWIAVTASQGKTRVVELLLAAGARPDHFEPGYGWTLNSAIKNGRTEVAKLLIAAGGPIKPRKKGDPLPLSLAAENGKLEIVKLLLDAGADPNCRNENGFDALMEASRVKGAAQPEIVKLLLDAGADPTFVTKVGWTAVLCAAEHGGPEVVQLLVDHGADVNCVTTAGTTLTSAASENRADNTALLLKLGADPLLAFPDASHKEFRGKSALEIARYWTARQVIPLLEAAVKGGKAKAAKRKTTSVADSWKRIEKWLAENDPDRLKSLGKPVKPDQFSKLEKAIGDKLPVEIKQSYQIHDGQSYESGLIEEGRGGNYFLLPTKEIIQEWKVWKSLVDVDEFEGRESNPEKGIRGDQWFNLKWIPIFSNGGGDSYCVDLDPAKGGKKGQVISMNHEDDDRALIAPSLKKLLSQLADDLESGAMVFSE